MIYKKIFYNGLTRYFLQGYLVLSTTTFLGLYAIDFSKGVGLTNSILTLMTFTFLPVWPLFVFYFLRKNKALLKDKKFKLKFNTMYHA